MAPWRLDCEESVSLEVAAMSTATGLLHLCQRFGLGKLPVDLLGEVLLGLQGSLRHGADVGLGCRAESGLKSRERAMESCSAVNFLLEEGRFASGRVADGCFVDEGRGWRCVREHQGGPRQVPGRWVDAEAPWSVPFLAAAQSTAGEIYGRSPRLKGRADEWVPTVAPL